MKSILKAIIVLFFLPFAFSCVHENEVYLYEDQTDMVDSEIPLPSFMDDHVYTYKNEGNSEKIWHNFVISEAFRNEATSKERIYENIPQIIPGQTTMDEVVEKYGIPPEVTIAETHIESGTSYYHLNFIYDELSLYFGINYDVLTEIRINDNSSFEIHGLSFDDSVEKVLALHPAERVDENVSEIGWEASAVLFKNIEGKKGYNYINYRDLNMRLFFWNDHVSALYLY